MPEKNLRFSPMGMKTRTGASDGFVEDGVDIVGGAGPPLGVDFRIIPFLLFRNFPPAFI